MQHHFNGSGMGLQTGLVKLCSLLLKVRASKEQQRKLKQLHWDKIRAPTEGTVWSRTSRAAPLNFDELESLFQVCQMLQSLSKTLGHSNCAALKRLVLQLVKEGSAR